MKTEGVMQGGGLRTIAQAALTAVWFSAVLTLVAPLTVHAQSNELSITQDFSSGRELNAIESAGLAAAAEAFATALDADDIARVLETAPPTLLESMARAANLGSAEEFLAVRREQARYAEQHFDFEVIDFDPGFLTRVGETENGVLFGFVPLRFSIRLPGRAFTVESDVLALMDAGVWYLVRIEDADQLAMLRAAYPGLADVEFRADRQAPVN